MAQNVDTVGKITGEWGKWQLRSILIIFLVKIPSAWFMACVIFTAPAPRPGEVYCKPPESNQTKGHTELIKISLWKEKEARDQEFDLDFCNTYKDVKARAYEYMDYDLKTVHSQLTENTNKNIIVIPCDSFEYNSSYYSVITQYDLVCSRDILVSVTQCFHLVGVLMGGLLATYLLNFHSPRYIMLLGMITQIICGNITGFVTSFEVHAFFRCLSSACCAQMFTAGAMIFTDITAGKARTSCICLFDQFWSIGIILLPLFSFFNSWSFVYIGISCPTIILVLLWRWIPDSPRWLLKQNRIEEAKEVLMECAKVNGTQDKIPIDLDEQLKQQSINLINAPPPAGWWTLWKGKRAVLHMICVHLAWSIYMILFFGMLLNIRGFSREHLEINTAIAGFCEMIGIFIGLYLILKTSLKWQITGVFNIIAGIIAYLAWIIPPEIQGNKRVALLMLSSMIMKVSVSCTLAVLITCTSELVSNEKKKICAFSTTLWTRTTFLIAPFFSALGIFGLLIPQTAMATMGIIGGVLTALIISPRTIPVIQPENKNLNGNLPSKIIPGIWTIENHNDQSKFKVESKYYS